MIRFYQIAPGDTLSHLARRFGTSVEALARLNKLADPNRIRAGDVVMVPVEPSPEDRLRIESAKAAPRHEAAQRARPSQTPTPAPGRPSIQDTSGMYFEIDLAPPLQPQGPAAPQAKGAAGGEAPQGPGYIETDKSVPYPPHHPSQMLYPQFWADFLDQALPQAVLGARGPGGAFMRAMGRLRDIDNPFVQINPQRAEFMRRAGRHFQRFPDEPIDPNYGQVFQPRVNTPRPSLDEALSYKASQRFPRYDYSDFRTQETPFAGRALPEHYPNTPDVMIGASIGRLIRDLIGPSEAAGPPPQGGYPPYVESLVNAGARARPEVIMARGRADTVAPFAGPGSSFAKGTTVAKNVSPFAAAIRRGMERAAGQPIVGAVTVAGDIIPFPEPWDIDPRNPLKPGGGSAAGGPRRTGNVTNLHRRPELPDRTKFSIARLEQQHKIKRPKLETFDDRMLRDETYLFLQNPRQYLESLAEGIRRAGPGTPGYADANKLYEYFARLLEVM